MSSILEKGKEYYNNYSQKDPWENATFSIIKKMENDVRGSFGEKIIYGKSNHRRYYFFCWRKSL